MAHNRGCRKLNNLDLWAGDNLEEDNKKAKFFLDSEEGCITLGDNYAISKTKSTLLVACWNYVEVMRELFPLDVGPRPIYRVLLTMMPRASTTPTLMRKFFAEAVEENAGRACREVPPLSYEKLTAR